MTGSYTNFRITIGQLVASLLNVPKQELGRDRRKREHASLASCGFQIATTQCLSYIIELVGVI